MKRKSEKDAKVDDVKTIIRIMIATELGVCKGVPFLTADLRLKRESPERCSSTHALAEIVVIADNARWHATLNLGHRLVSQDFLLTLE